jgi:hypothetical protein
MILKKSAPCCEKGSAFFLLIEPLINRFHLFVNLLEDRKSLVIDATTFILWGIDLLHLYQICYIAKIDLAQAHCPSRPSETCA